MATQIAALICLMVALSGILAAEFTNAALIGGAALTGANDGYGVGVYGGTRNKRQYEEGSDYSGGNYYGGDTDSAAPDETPSQSGVNFPPSSFASGIYKPHKSAPLKNIYGGGDIGGGEIYGENSGGGANIFGGYNNPPRRGGDGIYNGGGYGGSLEGGYGGGGSGVGSGAGGGYGAYGPTTSSNNGGGNSGGNSDDNSGNYGGSYGGGYGQQW